MWDITSEEMNSPIFWLYAFLISVVVVILWQYWQNRFSIPTYGGIASFSRTLSAQRLRATARDECMRAYAKDPIFLVPIGDGWAALAHSKYADEIIRAPDEVLSSIDAATERIQLKYNFGFKASKEDYHIQVVRNQLSRHLSGLFPDVLEETAQAITDYVGTEPNEWRTINVLSLSQKLVSRASNRIFVGLPLCRNEEWVALTISVTASALQLSAFINGFPAILRPLVGWYKSPSAKHIDAAMKIAGSFVEKKLADPEGTETDNFISWLIAGAPEYELNPRDILNRLLLTNFGAIQTSSLTLTNSLYWLLARPQYIDPLLQEITEVTSRLGWSKEAIGAMPKLDSFVKESMRISPLLTQTLGRKVRKPFTFSNGFQAPVGMTVSTHLYATHHDENLYPRPDVFDGFRFVELATTAGSETEKAGGDSTVRKTMYTTSRSYLGFGHGRSACPGRFFASMEIKLVLAYLIVNYEMKWPDTVYDPSVPGYTEEGYRPPDHCHLHAIIPDTGASMMIRKRVSARRAANDQSGTLLVGQRLAISIVMD